MAKSVVKYKKRGGKMEYYTYYMSPLGKMLLAEKEGALAGAWFENQKYYAARLEKTAQLSDGRPVLQAAKKWLDAYFAGEKPCADSLPLSPQGTDFQKEIWRLLLEIPCGKTVSYGCLAEQYAKKKGLSHMSAQAVGGAVGKNPISVFIPCHRVVGSNGSLTGYAGGLDKKNGALKV